MADKEEPVADTWKAFKPPEEIDLFFLDSAWDHGWAEPDVGGMARKARVYLRGYLVMESSEFFLVALAVNQDGDSGQRMLVPKQAALTVLRSQKLPIGPDKHQCKGRGWCKVCYDEAGHAGLT